MYWRGGVADHGVYRERGGFGEAGDQRDIRQTGREEPVCAGFRICARSSDHLDDHGIVMLLWRSLEKDIGSSIDEETDTGCIGRLPSAPDATDLIGCLAELSIFRKTVFQVTAYGAGVDRQTDRFADHF